VINLNKGVYTSTLNTLLESFVTINPDVYFSELILPLVILTVY